MSEAPTSQAFTDSSVRFAQIANPQSDIVHFNDPLPLDCGGSLSPYSIAYQTYGTLNEAKSNVILVCHALTGDQHVANIHPVTGKPGWWDTMVGPGKPIDTDRYFVLCPNVLGGCMGSTGPSSINPATGTAYGPDFPVITIGDMVRAQARLLDHLGIPDLLSVLGGSMGGMQVLEWAAEYKDRVYSAVPIACAARHSSQNIAFHEVGRQAVMADPEWCQGRYLDEGRSPRKGLAVARMAAHITYLSDDALHEKFGRSLQDRDKITFGFDADFQVESYLRHQGLSFVDRFDANSYLYITRAMDYFDMAADHDGVLANAFAGTRTRFCLVSFTSDWLFPTEESREIVHALNAVAANVSFVEIKSNKGHDAFLLHEPELFATIRGFLSAAANQRGVAVRRGASMNVNVPPHAVRHTETSRVDLLLIAEMVAPGSRVLDIGCGDGTLLRLLAERRGVDARGIELSQAGVNSCVAQGLAVIQGDADTDLVYYPDLAFDYAILSQTIQATYSPRDVLEQLLRIGRHVIVSFPNFGHWNVRARLLFGGKMPRTDNLPDRWYETPNIHLCTIKDFRNLCEDIGAKVDRVVALNAYGRKLGVSLPNFAQNLFGEQAVFVLSR